MQFYELEVVDGDPPCGSDVSWGFWVGFSQVILMWFGGLVVVPLSVLYWVLVIKPKARELRAAAQASGHALGPCGP